MRIERPSKGVGEAYRVGGARPTTAPSETQGTQTPGQLDSVSVSQKAQQATALRSKLKAAPEVRMDLVQRIKAEVEAGTYNVSPEKVAEKLLKSRVLDS